MSRTKNSVRNVVFGIVTQATILIINFLSRTIFIKTLGSEYLGVNGLYTDILNVLSLLELGFGNAMLYTLYRPLAKKDQKQIASLMNFYKKIYRVVMLLIAIIGLTIIPFLQFIVHADLQISELRWYYLLFLLNTIASYAFAYRTTIINADQKMHIIKTYHMISMCVQFLLQTIVLYTTHNFTLYLIIQILCTLGNNLALNLKAKKEYPYATAKLNLSRSKQKEIYKNAFASFILKISGIIVNNTDNILISIMVGTVWVGYYSNYFLIITAATSVLNIIFSAVTASIGNMTVKTNAKKQYAVFSDLSFIAFWLSGVVAICALFLLNDFINIWIGQEYLLDRWSIIAIIVNFYMMSIMNPLWSFRDATGLFKDLKLASTATAVINLVLSIVLGYFFGIFGILISTAISRLVTIYWYTPYKLFKEIFQVSPSIYFAKQVSYSIVLIMTYFILSHIMPAVTLDGIAGLIVKAFISFAISNAIILIAFRNTEEVRSLKRRFLPIINKYWQRIRHTQ